MRRSLPVLLVLLALLVPVSPAAAVGNCSAYRTWVTGNSLTAPDLSQSMIQAATTNSTPACVDDASPDASGMQTATDPFPSNAVSLPTSLGGELERIRYVLKNMFGLPQWYMRLPAAAFRSHLAGCTLSNDGVSPNTVIDIAACVSMDSTQATLMGQSSAYTKTTGAWVVATGNGCLDTGSVAANTWYHVHQIERTDTGVVDYLCSLSATAPTMPTSYTPFRRIGSFKTAAATTNILTFTQDGDYVRWKASVLDVNSGTNPGTGAITRTLASVPSGVNVTAIFNSLLDASTTGNSLAFLVSDLDANDEAPSNTVAPLAMVGASGPTAGFAGGPHFIRTNTSGQVRARLNLSGANDRYYMAVIGYLDSRGKNN